MLSSKEPAQSIRSRGAQEAAQRRVGAANEWTEQSDGGEDEHHARQHDETAQWKGGEQDQHRDWGMIEAPQALQRLGEIEPTPKGRPLPGCSKRNKGNEDDQADRGAGLNPLAMAVTPGVAWCRVQIVRPS